MSTGTRWQATVAVAIPGLPERSIKSRLIDRTGQRFGRLVVKEYAGGRGNSRDSLWLCLCDCGAERIVGRGHLVSGHTTSCGCSRGKHRLANKVPEYCVWENARSRCNNPNNRKYPAYGGRGISFTSRWDDFAVFLADVGPRPSANHSLDRIDNDRGYEPGNVRWATRVEQARNTRGNRLVTHNGITKHVIDWAAEAGMVPGTLGSRLDRGLPMEIALNKPVRRRAFPKRGVSKT